MSMSNKKYLISYGTALSTCAGSSNVNGEGVM